MDRNKTNKSNLENKKTTFFLIGLIISLLFVYFAFEYKSYDKITIDLMTRVADDIPEEMVQITEQKVKPPPPPPQQKAIIIKIVENDVEVEDDLNIDIEADDETVVEEYTYVEDEEIIENEIFTVVESVPQFPGGSSALFKYLSDNIKYPTMARETGVQGRVFINFVVEKDGSITDIKVLRGIGFGCDEEAVKVVSKMPKWTPGKQRGRAVRVSYNLPVKFTLM